MSNAGPGHFVLLADREDGLPLACQPAVQIPINAWSLQGKVLGHHTPGRI